MNILVDYLDNYRKKNFKLIKLPKKILLDSIPRNDKDAFKAYPKLNKLKNRLWLAKSQNLGAGTMNEIPKKFPVFVKPTDGAEDGGGNRDCHFVKNIDQFKLYQNNKKLFWAQYLTGKEFSADIIFLRGEIQYVLIYKIKIRKDKKILEDYKKVSSDKKLPKKIIFWLKKYVKSHTGILNIQYRGDYIFESSPRPDGAGRFLNYTRNPDLVNAINNLYLYKYWNWSNKTKIKKYYVFKVAAKSPFLVPLGYSTIMNILKKHKVVFYYFYTDISDNGKSFICLISKRKQKLINCRKELEYKSMIFNYFLISIILLQLYRYYHIIASGKNQFEATIILSLTLVAISIYRRVLMSDSGRSKLTPF